MTKMNQKTKSEEALFYCERHGVMTKPSNLKEKADQIAKHV
ncbi:MAG TPA: hypothetical protein VK503_01940 [Candidatus Bathyarchaeia archaeon]|nr:hypothetical protein [Candidatus Bathyarchaeia archaeon]